ncbi:BMP family ABC transporter substrate-binding protein [Sporosarcina thermotolerans]|uniref:BMP family ABC transporter substrate-binding protein n=1 Tax=Sporosarcina thermotolerans TaxID=633404 RepID=A0AAW9ADS9_9BACL|nr:BMP family ABC transporter substrate-binding protein [Sporosarcina thermotolerans]MDW0117778.1 BMP family ABC transporter substrate-binding protein [Sporosarcina thermotolerans]WHT49136.1 BMP family ABC transporter substrate-binding protein [Sporosarcina thermotolerans]
MNSTKKFAMVLLIAFMTVVMAACGSNAADKKEDKAGNSEDGLKIAIVTSPSGVDDGNFNEDNYNGILKFIENNPTATVKSVKEPTGDPAAAVQAVADIVADYDVIVTPGFQFAGVSSIAVENPDKIFIMNDTEPAPVDGQTEFDNIYAMNFAEQESGFFAGMAAALETKTNKVAVVNGIAYPSNVNYQFGFESGVNYANKVYGKSVELVELSGYAGTDVTGADVGGNYAGSFADEATGKVIGNALIKQGVDILFVAAGGTGNGVFTAAKEAKNDVKVIGVDVDQYDDGSNGSENIVLTSAVKFMAMNIEKSLNSVADGSFKGGNVVLYADTESTGFIKEEGRHQLSEDTLNKLNEAYELVKDGTIVPASNFNGNTPEEFPGL